MTLNAINLKSRHRCPCNPQAAVLLVGENFAVSSVSDNTLGDVALSNADDSRILATVPDDVDAKSVYVIEFDGFKVTPRVRGGLDPREYQRN